MIPEKKRKAAHEDSWTNNRGGPPDKKDKKDTKGKGKGKDKDKGKKTMLTATHFNKREICKRHNDARGCTKEEKDCPAEKLHVCDFLLNGKACGKDSHKRPFHER